MAEAQQQFCPDEPMAAVLNIVQASDEEGLKQLSSLIELYPFDPRLHFLAGSVLAGVQRYEEGRSAMTRAVEIAPGYELARFQLGFLELTSGLAAEAERTWAAFEELDEGHPFRLLSTGLNALARDEFPEANRLIHMGMEANAEHPMINNDMQLLLDEIADKVAASKPSDAPAEDDPTGASPASATQILLQQFELKDSVNKKPH